MFVCYAIARRLLTVCLIRPSPLLDLSLPPILLLPAHNNGELRPPFAFTYGHASRLLTFTTTRPVLLLGHLLRSSSLTLSYYLVPSNTSPPLGRYYLHTSNCSLATMNQPPQADPQWIALRTLHQQECDEFARKVEAGKREFQRRVNAAQDELFARHSQQEGDHWRRHDQKASNASSPAPTITQPIAPKAQPTASRPSATPVYASRQEPLHTPDPARRQSPFKAFNSRKQNGRVTTPASAAQQQAKQPSKQSLQPSKIQQQSSKEAPTGSIGRLQPPKPGQTKPRATASRTKVTTSQTKATPKKEIEMIDLCSSDDDDMLVEVTKATCQQEAAPTVAPASFRPPIPTATLQLFGGRSQQPSVSFQYPL